MKRNKKAQIVGQIFVYILAIIIVGGIVLVGFWAVKTIQAKMCQVAQIDFKTDLEKLLRDSNSFGSVSSDSVSAPCNYNQVCLVDASKIGYAVSCDNGIVSSSVKDGQKMNIFLINNKATFPSGYSDKLKLEDSSKCLCIGSVNGRFYFQFEGQGPTTLVKKGNAYGS